MTDWKPDQKTLQVLASAFKKTLPPELLREVLSYLDPLSEFLAMLRRD